MNASRRPSRDVAHHSGSGRLAIPYPVKDSHLLFFASFAWRTPSRVIRYRFGRDRLSTNVRSASIPTVNSGLWDLSRCAMKRREQVQRNCQCASTSRQKTHQAKADRAPRSRQCLIIAPRSSTCRVELHWRLPTAPGATLRSTISSASIRLQRLRLACRSGAQLIPILVMAGPVLAMHVFGQIYSIHFERGPPCQKKRSRRRNRKPN